MLSYFSSFWDTTLWQSCCKVATCTTNVQRCSDADVTTSNLKRCSNIASTCEANANIVFTTSIIQRQNYSVAPTLPQRCIVSSSHKYTLNVVLSTLLQRWNRNVSFTASIRQHQIYNVVVNHGCYKSCTICYGCNSNVDTALPPRRQIYNVFRRSILRRYTNVALVLRGKSNANQRRIQKLVKHQRQSSFWE